MVYSRNAAAEGDSEGPSLHLGTVPWDKHTEQVEIQVFMEKVMKQIVHVVIPPHWARRSILCTKACQIRLENYLVFIDHGCLKLNSRLLMGFQGSGVCCVSQLYPHPLCFQCSPVCLFLSVSVGAFHYAKLCFFVSSLLSWPGNHFPSATMEDLPIP